ncbi:MAG: AsmA-like C-terminal domain-containing protein [Pseudomonadota bacterium]
MLARTTKIALEIVTGLLTFLAVLIAVAVWRLSTGPVELNFLNPFLEESLNAALDGNKLTIGRTILIWRGDRNAVGLEAKDLRLRNPTGQNVVELPDLDVKLSLRALLQGTVAPTTVSMRGAHIHVVRSRDGRFILGSGSARRQLGEAPSADFSGELSSLLDRIMASADPGKPLSFLQSVQLIDGRLTVQDERLGFSWDAPMPSVKLDRAGEGLTGEAYLGIGALPNPASVRIGLYYQHSRRSVTLTAFFSDLRPLELEPLIGDIGPVGRLTIPLRGSLAVTMDVDGHFSRAEADIVGAAGPLALPGVFDQPLPLREFVLKARLTQQGRHLELSQARFDFDGPDGSGPSLALSGAAQTEATMFAGPIDIVLEAEAQNVTAEQLEIYWPVQAAHDAREWVIENITAGAVDRASAQVSARWDDPKDGEPVVEALAGELDYRDLEVHYLPPLPPVTGVSGTSRFDLSSFTFDVEQGQVSIGSEGILKVADATIHITGLDSTSDDPTQAEQLALELTADGPITAALTLLDNERLDLLSGLGIDPKGSGGAVSADVDFQFPLLEDLTFDQMEIQTEAKLSDLELSAFVFGQNVTDGQIDLSLDKDSMRLVGPLKLGGVATEITWQEQFNSDVTVRTELAASLTNMTDAQRQAFGLDIQGMVKGPVSAKVDLKVDPENKGQADVIVDLTQAGLEIEGLDWTKAAGTPGTASLAVLLQDYVPTSYRDIVLDAGTIRANGWADANAAGDGLRRLHLSQLSHQGTSLQGVTLNMSEAALDIEIAGGTLDAGAILWPERGNQDKADQSNSAESSDSSDSNVSTDLAYDQKDFETDDTQSVTLSAPSLKRMVFGSGRYLQDVTLEFQRVEKAWQSFMLSGGIPDALWSLEQEADSQSPSEPAKETNGSPISEDEAATVTNPIPHSLRIDFRPGGTGYDLTVETTDFGAALRSLNIIDTLGGGNFKLVGQSDGPLTAAPLKGQVEMEDFVLLKAPVMARLLTIGSLTGLSDTLQGDGIAFRELAGDFTLTDETLTIGMLRTHGPALGLTAQGNVELEQDQTHLRGTLVPAYTINNLLGEIPLIGDFLIGGEGEGLLALTYKISGPIEDPDISVNPLSALAPGFLRGLFTLGDGEDAPDEIGAFPKDQDERLLQK